MPCFVFLLLLRVLGGWPLRWWCGVVGWMMAGRGVPSLLLLLRRLLLVLRAGEPPAAAAARWRAVSAPAAAPLPAASINSSACCCIPSSSNHGCPEVARPTVCDLHNPLNLSPRRAHHLRRLKRTRGTQSRESTRGKLRMAANAAAVLYRRCTNRTGRASICFSRPFPSRSFPNTTCFPSRCGVRVVVMKNWRGGGAGESGISRSAAAAARQDWRAGSAVPRGRGFGRRLRRAWLPLVFGPAFA